MDAAVPLTGRPPDHRSPALAAAWLATSAAIATTAAIALTGAREDPLLVAVARALMVGAPVAVGLLAWQRSAAGRFGLVLAAAGAGWFLTTLAEADDSAVYTIGRTAGWLVEVLLVYLILAFPTGRLTTRTDRRLVAATAVVVLTMFVPRLALARTFEVPSPFTSCVRACPENALFALGEQPGVVDDVLRPGGLVLVVLVMIGVLARLGQRIARTAPLARPMFFPVLAVASAHAGLMAAGFVVRHIDPGARASQVIAWLLALVVPALAGAFLLGLLRWRLFTARALSRLAACLSVVPDAATLRAAFAEAFGDPSIEIAFPSAGRDREWVDPRGVPMHLPRAGSGRSVSEVRDGDKIVAALVHDDVLSGHPELLRAGTAMAAVVLDNQRLAAETEVALREVRQSRARIAASAERERRRIERDLHDGAQQRLVALRIELGLAEEQLPHDPDHVAAQLRQLEREVDDALDELRSLAHGVSPPLLADRGLAEALRAAMRRSAIPVELELRDVPRYPPEVESAVYFCVTESLQNALKHAEGARRVVVRLDGGGGNGLLRFAVQDDGAGAPDGTIRPGAGLANMRDRVAAVGGDVRITSTPRVGTTVRGYVPASRAA